MSDKPTFVCSKCGYVWTPRLGRLEQNRKKPVRCANQACQTVNWDKEGN